MTTATQTISIPVDVTNPGQFFACCGLLELTARLCPDAAGRFIDKHFEIAGVPADTAIVTVIQRLQDAGLVGALTPELAKERGDLEERKKAKDNLEKVRTTLRSNKKMSAEKRQKLRDREDRLSKLEPLKGEEEARRDQLGKLLRSGFVTVRDPFGLRLDWWQGDSDEVPKPWAGSMQVRRVAAAALTECISAFSQPRPFGYACVLRPTDDEEGDDTESEGEEDGKAEPFYFDCTRGSNAHPVDQGFSANKLSVWRDGPLSKSGKIKRKQVKMESAAFPAVELLALIGLQRFRPMPPALPRVFVYRAWTILLPPCAAAAAACGLLPGAGGDLYRFENAFRTDQRKHKGFLPANRINQGDTI